MSIISVVNTEKQGKLPLSSWKYFTLSDIFEIGTGASIKKEELVAGDMPRISVTNMNNGIQGYYGVLGNNANYRTNENFISFSFLGTCFYHPYKASLDMKVHTLKPKNYNLTRCSGLFLVSILRESFTGLSYGDQLSSSDLKDLKILLPANVEGEPDWTYMENYMGVLQSEVETSVKALLDVIHRPVWNGKIDVTSWQNFKLLELFDIKLAKGDIQAKNMEIGSIPLVSAGMANNGIVMYIKNGDGISEIFPGNVLTVDMFGQAFYQEHSFFAVSHGRVNILVPKFRFNKGIGLFFSTILNKKFTGRYSFSEMCSQSKLDEEVICLPVKNGHPDLDYMETYAKTLYEKLSLCV